MQQQFDLKPYDETLRNYVLAVYILFALAVFFGGITAIVGIIIAYVKRDDTVGTIYHDHLSFLIRTFWTALAGMFIGGILLIIWIGALLIFAVGIWYIFRVVVGAIRFFDNKSITPTGWFM